LHARVAEVVSAMTGATGVHLVLWNEDRQDWLLRASASAEATVPISGGGHDRAIPLSVLRYVERTRDPLVVNDAAHDDRFARDPYFANVACCSLLAVPILSRGVLRAVLVLENRLIHGAFTSERLDAVKLIAGQLAVSLDNAQLYAEVRRIADQYRLLADEHAALRRVATLVAEAAPPSAVFTAVTEEVGRLLSADVTGLGRYQEDATTTMLAVWRATADPAVSVELPVRMATGEGAAARVQKTGRPARVNEFTPDTGASIASARLLGLRSAVAAPIMVAGRLWGVLSVAATGDEPPPPDTEDRLAAFAALAATAIANADSRDQLIASRARLLTASDEARRRVVRDLHDGAQQRLVHTIIALELARRAMREGDEEAESLVAEAVTSAEQANRELRDLTHGILPAGLVTAGLRAAVESMVERLDVPVMVDISAERVPAEIEANAYFIVAEALTNTIKHAGATCAAVKAGVEDGALHLEVRDDGVGGADPAGNGLVGIEDRATALGGRFTLHSPPGGGTVLTVALPISGWPVGIPDRARG
jgi:signal transduction histidine kinase